jgi:hypothetical protein
MVPQKLLTGRNLYSNQTGLELTNNPMDDVIQWPYTQTECHLRLKVFFSLSATIFYRHILYLSPFLGFY